MSAKNNKYGYEIVLSPKEIFNNFQDSFEQDNIYFFIENEKIFIGYDDKNKKNEAESLLKNFIRIWEFKRKQHIHFEYNSSWSYDSNRKRSLTMYAKSAKLKSSMNDVKFTHAKEDGSVIENDTRDFSQFKNEAQIISSDDILKEILQYYEKDILGAQSENDMYYGIYKIAEIFIKMKLYQIIGYDKTILKKLKESCQHKRHAITPGDPKRIFSPKEGQELVRDIIDKYISHLK
jgi:hypothetical protein